MLTRRNFLKISALAGASMFLPLKWLMDAPPAFAFSQSQALRKFIQPLRRPGGVISIASPDKTNPGWWQPGVTHYTIDIGQFEDQLHPDLPNPTRLWGFGQNYSSDTASWTNHLGGIIAAKRGEPVQITFRNHLPNQHIMPVDTTIMGANLGVSRADIHLHGGLVPWTSDGGPFAWWDPNGNHGESFLNNQVLRPGQTVPKNEAEYYYPNNQGARLLWYHDHTFGNTRFNAYAGIASGYVVYDDYELALVQYSNLPGPLDPRTVYLVFQDKIFVQDSTETNDPTWFNAVADSRAGDLWYAHQYEKARWVLGAGTKLPDVSCIPEFFGDTMLVNGAVYPYFEVEPRQYRLRMLNACNARFLNPRLVYAQTSAPTEADPTKPGPAFIQIATEGGFLPNPVMVNGPAQTQLLLAPAERADLIVDFRDVSEGSVLILYGDADAPFPMGDGLNDYNFPANPDNPTPTATGFGPNTRTIMQFRVKARVGAADPGITLPAALTPTDPFIINQVPQYATPVPRGVKIRYLTLNETFDEFGRLIQFLGTNEPINSGLLGRAYSDAPTEVIDAGSTEVWEIINMTGDVHPIHFHLVNVQVLARQDFDDVNYTSGLPDYTHGVEPPDDNELGWKETVRMYPGQVTRVMMRFTLAAVPFAVPLSTRTGITGHEFVWHCHMLEHEEHDMMRPMIIKDNKSYMPFIE
jgi:spore coat protein A